MIYRYYSVLMTEEIAMVLQSSLKTYYDDNYLRGMSYIYADNGRNNYTSHASFEIKGSV